MATEDYSTIEANPLLNDDPFRNEHTQRLFEAIDELRRCGADHDVGLPEVSAIGILREDGDLNLVLAACHCRRSVGWKVILIAELDRHSIPCG